MGTSARGVTNRLRRCASTPALLLALVAANTQLLGCGPEPVDGAPFEDPSRGPFYMPPSGAGGGAGTSSTSESAQSDSTTSDALETHSTRVLAGEADVADEPDEPQPDPPVPECCRICVRGKACGDSCISAELTCQVGRGCACDG